MKKTYRIFDKVITLPGITAKQDAEFDETFKRVSKLLVEVKALRKENATLKKQIKVKKVKRNFKDAVKKIAIGFAYLALAVPPLVIGFGIWFLMLPAPGWLPIAYEQRLLTLLLILAVEFFILKYYATVYQNMRAK